MISLILAIALVGFLCWLVITYIPMPAPFPAIIVVVMVILLILYIASALGFRDIPIRG